MIHTETVFLLFMNRHLTISGFDGTSNVLAGKLYGIPVRGTHAHAFVTSYTALEDLQFKVGNLCLTVKVIKVLCMFCALERE